MSEFYICEWCKEPMEYHPTRCRKYCSDRCAKESNRIKGRKRASYVSYKYWKNKK